MSADKGCKYLVIDPGHSMGYCILDINNKIGTITKYGFHEIDHSSEYSGDWCNNLKKWVKEKIKTENIMMVIREDYFFSGRFRSGSGVNVSYRTAIDMATRKLKLPYHVVSPSIWKKFICGRSTPTKEQKKKYGKNAKKYMINEALWLRYKIKFPNYTHSQKNGRNIKFKHDIVDAVAMGIYFLRIIRDVNKVVCEVECPLDIEWKGNVKIFNYDDIGKQSNVELNNSKIKPPSKVKSGLKCPHIFKSGNRKGLVCNTGIRGSYEKCSKHRSKKPKKAKVELKKESVSKVNLDLPIDTTISIVIDNDKPTDAPGSDNIK